MKNSISLLGILGVILLGIFLVKYRIEHRAAHDDNEYLILDNADHSGADIDGPFNSMAPSIEEPLLPDFPPKPQVYENDVFSFEIPEGVSVHQEGSKPRVLSLVFSYQDPNTGADLILPLSLVYPVLFVGSEFDENLDEQIHFYQAQNLPKETFVSFIADEHNGYLQYSRLDATGEQKICGPSVNGSVEGNNPLEILTIESQSECPYQQYIVIQTILDSFISTLKFK